MRWGLPQDAFLVTLGSCIFYCQMRLSYQSDSLILRQNLIWFVNMVDLGMLFGCLRLLYCWVC